MKGRINSGDRCEIAPISEKTILEEGQVALCRVGGNDYLHQIKAIKNSNQFLISNQKGRENG